MMSLTLIGLNQTLPVSSSDGLNTAVNDNVTNRTTGELPWDETPLQIRQYLLIFRLILLGLGLIGNVLLILIYVKCSNIITTRLGVYIINLAIAFIIDLLDVVLWSLKEFNVNYDADAHPMVIKIALLPSLGIPTTSLFFLLMIIDRFFATCFARCYKSCYGCTPSAVLLSVIIWMVSFFFYFILTFKDILFPYESLHSILRIWISYFGPFVVKLLLSVILIVKRKTVPDNDESQAFVMRHRNALYYTLIIVIIHMLLSIPWYLIQLNIIYDIINFPIDVWIQQLCYFITEVPLVLNPIFCLSIHPEFKDSLVSLCTCSGRARRDAADIGDDHAESQPLAPLATSPIAEEKEHLDDTEP